MRVDECSGAPAHSSQRLYKDTHCLHASERSSTVSARQSLYFSRSKSHSWTYSRYEGAGTLLVNTTRQLKLPAPFLHLDHESFTAELKWRHEL